jgi:hypothetical protein
MVERPRRWPKKLLDPANVVVGIKYYTALCVVKTSSFCKISSLAEFIGKLK